MELGRPTALIPAKDMVISMTEINVFIFFLPKIKPGI